MDTENHHSYIHTMVIASIIIMQIIRQIIMQTDLPVRGCYVKGGVAHKVLVIDVSPVTNEQLCMFHMTILTRLRGRSGKKYNNALKF